MISIIAPVFNEEQNIGELCNRIVAAVKPTGHKFEILLIENGSTDESLALIKRLQKSTPQLKYLSLSRNFGHQGGILAGLANATGDAVISMDGDLQHPPELIPQMIKLWEQGADVVYTIKERVDHDDWRALPSRAFYGLMSYLTDVKLSYGQSDFRLLDRRVLDVLNSIPEKNKFIRGMVQWLGFRQIGIRYQTAARMKGESKFRLKHYVRFAIDGVFSFSVFPLRLFLYFGLFVAALCFLYGLFVVALMAYRYFGHSEIFIPPGWSTLALGMTFLGSVQLIGIGILGEFLGRVYEQVKQRPDFVVRDAGAVRSARRAATTKSFS